jgi:hypothetical protein
LLKTDPKLLQNQIKNKPYLVSVMLSYIQAEAELDLLALQLDKKLSEEDFEYAKKLMEEYDFRFRRNFEILDPIKSSCLKVKFASTKQTRAVNIVELTPLTRNTVDQWCRGVSLKPLIRYQLNKLLVYNFTTILSQRHGNLKYLRQSLEEDLRTLERKGTGNKKAKERIRDQLITLDKL